MPDPRFPGPRTFVLPEETPAAGAYLAPVMQGTPSQTFRVPASMAQLPVAEAQIPRNVYGFLAPPPEGGVPLLNPTYEGQRQWLPRPETDPWYWPEAAAGPEGEKLAWLAWYLRRYNAGDVDFNNPAQIFPAAARNRREDLPTAYTSKRGPLPPDFEDLFLRHTGYGRTPQGVVPIPESAKLPVG